MTAPVLTVFTLRSSGVAAFLAGALRPCPKRGFFGAENGLIGVIAEDQSPAWYWIYITFFFALIVLALAASITLFFLTSSS